MPPEVYKTAIDDMATVIAQITSGIAGAIPEQADFDLADETIREIEKKLSDV